MATKQTTAPGGAYEQCIFYKQKATFTTVRVYIFYLCAVWVYDYGYDYTILVSGIGCT